MIFVSLKYNLKQMEKFKQIENTNYLVSNTGKIVNARTSRNNSLTYIDVQVIRKAFKSGKLTIRELSEKYKTSASNITSIVYCRTWKHVGDDLQINL